VVAAAKEQDGNTVLKLADRSTITLVGVARLDELTLFDGPVAGNPARGLERIPERNYLLASSAGLTRGSQRWPAQARL